jgi:hypothetical protein
VAPHEDVWIPLVDEPIGSIVRQVEEEHPEIAKLVETPSRLLAFRTFAYIRVGVLLGQLLVESEIDADDGPETWIHQLLDDPAHREAVVKVIRTVAEEVAADPSYAGEETLGPDPDARRRFRDFARRRLEAQGGPGEIPR